jgi:type II restriction/modification system DNA methylase subunit YeeA
MTPQQFIAKWKPAELSERSACQQHFLDLCELLDQPKPAEVDPKGDWYTFERGTDKVAGGRGWADVWMQGKFGWEYKGKHKDLKAAYQQLLQYREALENPPLLVVCDLDRFEIHTNFTGTVKTVHAFDLDGLADPKNILLLRQLFTNPEALKPGKTQAVITEEIAHRFARLADGMRARDIPAERAAHFLMKLMFCMFAEDVELLPRDLFKKTVANAKRDSARLTKLLRSLFDCMAKGESFGAESIEHFNGGLFDNNDAIDLNQAEINALLDAAECDWSQVEPTIFGTVFERTLDPNKRSQIGAHFTSRADIETLLQPVMMEPLRREWTEVKAKADELWSKAKGTKAKSKARLNFELCVTGFLDRLAHVTVLDPACGSGNFLFVALHLLLDLEKEVLTYLAQHGINRVPYVGPTHQLFGLEINPFAQQLAQVVIWIGYLQWMHFNGLLRHRDPVLDPFESVKQTDSILDLSEPARPKEPKWPEAEFIVGNPPFLGDKRMRGELGDEYVTALRKLYEDRIPGQSDLCCYWFEKARAQIERRKCKRAGLLATQSIRGGANRTVVDRIKKSGDIFWANSDRNWILDGANVHVSMIGFDDGGEKTKTLDSKPVATINSQLASSAAVADAATLAENAKLGFIGVAQKAPFDISFERAREWLDALNPHRRPNSDVLRPICNAQDITRRSRGIWNIDFGLGMPVEEAAKYGLPFEWVKKVVGPLRTNHREARQTKLWWLFARPCPDMRLALGPHKRFLATPRVSKHRVFAWLDPGILCDSAVVAFARSDDYFFGVLHSRAHEVWARAQGTQVRERESGFRYTPSTCFETFPFPKATPEKQAAIAAPAKELDELRSNWLNPPEWTKTETLEFPGSVDGPWKRYIHDPDARGIGTVRYPRIVPSYAHFAIQLKPRTLTNLYNEMPTWLANAHRKLDEAVFAAYGWSPDLTDDDLLAKLLELNLSRAGQAAPAAHSEAVEDPDADE